MMNKVIVVLYLQWSAIRSYFGETHDVAKVNGDCLVELGGHLSGSQLDLVNSHPQLDSPAGSVSIAWPHLVVAFGRAASRFFASPALAPWPSGID